MATDIKSLSREDLLQWLTQHHVRPFRADQILKWLYLRLAHSFDQMTDLSQDFRMLLDRSFIIARMPIAQTLTARDGTRKYLFQLEDGNTVESVLIPEKGHYTLCVSSQVGCAQGCRFCLTGEGGLVRNLTSAEIVGQIWEIRKKMPQPGQLTNLVFMGMGEPLANYRQLVRALEVLTNSQWGMKFAHRRITVSTAGIVPRIIDLGRDTQVNLAISLNAPDDASRTRLMPINRKYPIAELLDVCRLHSPPRGRKITFEYILFKDVNDSLGHAKKLAKLLAGVKAKINLIPFNPFPGSEFKRPSQDRIDAFQAVLVNKHYTAIVRYSKGLDIMAACGQLRANGAAQK
ncbi:MAG: 23S rRNA (adenine(2503)-C(2))-methyltransferase RlmN [Desulfobacteraceae bacterium]|jgi:23S rRNA (adenine2503-C2)-methyltransferase